MIISRKTLRCTESGRKEKTGRRAEAASARHGISTVGNRGSISGVIRCWGCKLELSDGADLSHNNAGRNSDAFLAGGIGRKKRNGTQWNALCGQGNCRFRDRCPRTSGDSGKGKDELKGRMGEHTYVAPIPPEVKPDLAN